MKPYRKPGFYVLGLTERIGYPSVTAPTHESALELAFSPGAFVQGRWNQFDYLTENT